MRETYEEEKNKHYSITLFCCYFRQVGGSPFVALLVVEFNTNAMDSHFPVGVIGTVFEVAQDGNGHMQLCEFLTRDRTKPRVFYSTEIIQEVPIYCVHCDIEQCMYIIPVYFY